MSDSLARLRPSLGPPLVVGLRVTGLEDRVMSGPGDLASVLTGVSSLASRSSSGLMGWRLPRMA